MKRSKKSAVKNVDSMRIATYLPVEIVDWLIIESTRLDRKPSAFIRQVLREKMQSTTEGA